MTRIETGAAPAMSEETPVQASGDVKACVFQVADRRDRDIAVEIYQGADGLEQLRSAWETLTGQIKDAFHIHTGDWYLSYLSHLESEPDTVHFVVVRRKSVPVAIVPLRYTRERLFGVQLRTWKFAARDQMDVSDIVVHPGESEADITGSVIRALKQFRKYPWDVLVLQNVREDSYAVRHYHRRAPAMGMILQTGASRFLSSDPAAGDPYDRLKGHFRRNLRRCNNKLDKMGALDFVQVSAPEEMRAAFDEFVELEASGWKGHENRGRAINSEERLLRFFGQVTENFTGKGRCLINFLRLDGNAIAGQLCILMDNRIHMLKIGFDEKYRNVSAGYVLLGRLLDRCAEQGVLEVDFITNGKWTNDWQALSRDVFRISIFNTSVAGISGCLAGMMVVLRGKMSGLMPESVKTVIRSLLRR